LDHHVSRLTEDHQKAKQLEQVLSAQPYVKQVLPVHTNIVIFELVDGITSEQALEKLSTYHVKAVPFGAQEVRFVTHLDFTEEMLVHTIEVLKKITF
jgi:threonine aldolase